MLQRQMAKEIIDMWANCFRLNEVLFVCFVRLFLGFVFVLCV